MAQNITLMGASYSNVPAVTLPKTGGGTARFDDATVTTATASDVASGKIFLASDGTITTGTNSGGGGSSNFTLLGTLSLGTISTSSTQSTDTGKSITIKGVYDYDLLVCECSVNTKTNNRHACTTRLCWLTASSAIGTKNGATFATATWNCKLSSNGTATTRSNTTAYGIYANGCTVSAGSTGDNGQAVITIYQRYNSTQTGTINGSYTMRVYGVKIYDLIGG